MNAILPQGGSFLGGLVDAAAIMFSMDSVTQTDTHLSRPFPFPVIEIAGLVRGPGRQPGELLRRAGERQNIIEDASLRVEKGCRFTIAAEDSIPHAHHHRILMPPPIPARLPKSRRQSKNSLGFA